MSLKSLLYSLAWIVPVIGGLLSLCLLVFARPSVRATRQYRPAFILSALGVMIAGLSVLLLNNGYNRLSVVAMLSAALVLVSGIVLLLRRLPRSS